MTGRKRYLFVITLSLILIAVTFTGGCGFSPEIQPLPAPLVNYEAMSVPPDNPLTPEKVALGRQLFFDERLSVDGSKSCYSCHVCEHGLTD